jgi:sporulation protein YlmC with PRC-barrel domain
MSERFTAVSGRTVISRTSAEELGKLAHIVIDVKRGQVASLVVGKGRKVLLIAWEQVSGFGPDAIMIADETALQEPRDDREQSAADVVFDSDTGAIESILVDDREEPAASLLGAGSFAVIVRAPAK